MKTKLYLAISADGYIAKPDDDTPWSDDAWNNYHEICNSAENLIVGRRTYEMMLEAGDFKNLKLKSFVVVSRQSLNLTEEGRTSANSPKAALSQIASSGAQEAILGGGRNLNQSFFEQGLVDEIELDVEPVLLGQGIPILGELAKDVRLELLETRKTGENTVRLHYRVI